LTVAFRQKGKRGMLVDFFNIVELQKRREQGGKPYLEFLRVPAMSAGIYALPTDGKDSQIPHKEDELYYVVRGRARMRVAAEEHIVTEGSVIFVAAGVQHYFHEIKEELIVLVFFAPAES
jgi:mannose-6-phosphate isomerase-like protein (cupin superfamily)